MELEDHEVRVLRVWIDEREEAQLLVKQYQGRANLCEEIIQSILADRPDLVVRGDKIIILSENAADPAVVADELGRMGASNASTNPC